ncbi:MAG: hypothetical protein ABW036_01615, partial [Flavitalea sp.]
LALTSFTNKDSVSEVKIYTIDFPPNELIAAEPSTRSNTGRFWLIGAAILLAGMMFAFVLRRKKPTLQLLAQPFPEPVQTQTNQPVTIEPVNEAPVQETIHDPIFNYEPVNGPSIHLFGQFQVTDINGHDITKQFSPLLKELFLLIFINSFSENKGISSEALTEHLWFNKSEKDARNNRAVNITKLKTILEKLGAPVLLSKDSGLWQLQVNDENIYNDYAIFQHLQHSRQSVDRNYIVGLMQIVRRGTFLSQTDYSWLDDIKSNVSNTVIDKFTEYLEKSNINEEAEFIIAITNGIFLFDRLNEQALEYKCKSLIILKRHALANTTYLNFAREYKEIYQEEFSRQFNEVIR